MRKVTFRAFGCLIKGVIFVHRDHDVFLQSVERETKLKLTFFSSKHRRDMLSLCAPLLYSKGPAVSATDAKNELECYYLWDSGAEKGSNFLALSPSEIVSMKLTEDVFHIQELYGHCEQVKAP
jgi:hypothetical protein